MGKKEDKSYDTETTGLRPYKGDKMFMYSTCDTLGNVFRERVDSSTMRRKKCQSDIRTLLSRNRLVMHNSKFDITMTGHFLEEDIEDEVEFHDTLIQSRLLQNNNREHGLKELAWELAGIPTDDEDAIKNFKDYSTAPDFIVNDYAGNDALRTMLLHMFFLPKLEALPKLYRIYENELELIRATIKMERRGVRISFPRCHRLIEELQDKRDQALHNLYAAAGYAINPNSASQVNWLLFEKFKLPVLARTPTGQPTTKKDVLAQLREHFDTPPVILDYIQSYRSYDKGVTTLLSYIEHADEEGIIHPSIETNEASTGRQACKEPNLQNVQKEETLLNPFPVPARRVFVPRPGYVNLYVDYSGIEMRLLIFYSREPKLLEVLRAGGDVHEPAALVFYRDTYELAEGKQRKAYRGAAKNANFATPYGAGARKVTRTLGLPEEIGKERYKEYCQQFPDLVHLGRNIGRDVREQGFVETVFGRILYLPRNKSYAGLNYLIQSTAADILKIATVRVALLLERLRLGVNLLLPIHDELVMEYPRSELRRLPDFIHELSVVMTDFPEFDIPLAIEVSASPICWADKKEVKF